MGGVIAREAMTHLLDYSDKFYAYCSFATPHLGILNSKIHIKFGLWISEIFNTYECLTQLRMKDALEIEDTYLFKLSQKEGLEHFEHVMFFTSHQDTLVPYYSSRVQVFKDDLESPHTNKLLEMNQNILERCSKGVTRVDVDFKIESGTFNSLIGRTAHLLFTSDQSFLHAFVNKYRCITGEKS